MNVPNYLLILEKEVLTQKCCVHHLNFVEKYQRRSIRNELIARLLKN
jgi:hypothetical protein